MVKDQNPFGLHTLTPYLMVEKVPELINFLQEVFQGTSRGEPKYRDDGSIQHAELQIGNSVVMMGEPMDGFQPMPTMLYLYVDDCDHSYERAISAGASSVLEPKLYPHGDRYGGVKDPVGNIWWIVTHMGKQK